MSSGNEVAREEYSSNSYHVEDRKTNGNYAELDSESSQGESNNVSSNDGSSEYQEWSEIKGNVIIGRYTRLKFNLINLNCRVTRKEELLVDGCKLMKVSLEVTIVLMACLRTDKQQGTMLHWMKDHYQDNPSEEELLQIAEEISEKVQ